MLRHKGETDLRGRKEENLRLAYNDFHNTLTRQENAIKFLPKWTEAFVILSLAGAFGMVLKKPARKYLADLWQKRI